MAPQRAIQLAGVAQTPALEGDYPRQVRIVGEQWRQVAVNPPINLAPRQVPLDGAQHRQRLHYVPKGTRFEDENLQSSGLRHSGSGAPVDAGLGRLADGGA